MVYFFLIQLFKLIAITSKCNMLGEILTYSSPFYQIWHLVEGEEGYMVYKNYTNNSKNTSIIYVFVWKKNNNISSSILRNKSKGDVKCGFGSTWAQPSKNRT